jgi:DNA-binding NtrC family response regulator
MSAGSKEAPEAGDSRLKEAAARAGFVAADPLSLALLDQIRKIAPTTSTVLIQGESGVGKDLAASLLHYLGPHPEEPLLKIDCASLPPSLMESELFGYERGAFTGANERKRGRLELAGSGTIVLDEISALSLAMQAKLLRVLEERRFDRLGGSQPVVISDSVRIIAISNLDLEQAVRRREFREDLYYRLHVVPLRIPPLRERPTDIVPLAEHFMESIAVAHARPRRQLSAAAARLLEQYSFPGNVRELRNLIERLLISSPSSSAEVSPEEISVLLPTKNVPKKMTLEELERAYIAEVLDFTRGRKSKAAEILGISRKTLLEKRKRYKLD